LLNENYPHGNPYSGMDLHFVADITIVSSKI
jgi:hypothetical protein